MEQILRLIAVFALLVGQGSHGQTAQKTDPWAGLRFLVGTWEAKTSGGNAQAAGAGTYSFRLELRDHVMVRHSGYDSCTAPKDFNCEHGDLLYIYPEGRTGDLQGIYFDNEGHVIHYIVTIPKAGTVVMLSDPGEGPQFRLSYDLTGDLMVGKFQMRAPGRSDFATYLEWSGKRKY